jgi:hygromycin-B 7''-O-kinase
MSRHNDPLQALETLDGYRRSFTDATLWSPYVRQVCQRHGLELCAKVRAGLPGTYPTFIVDDRWVVKFFGRLFDGGLAFETEYEADRLIKQDCTIPAPPVIASGQLLGEAARWVWPYLIFEYIPGISLGEVYARVSLEDRLSIAGGLGHLARRLHNLPLENSAIFPPRWEAYRDFLNERYRRCHDDHLGWGTLPEHLVEQIDNFLPPLDELVDFSLAPHLIHADITHDHLLGRLDGGRWTTLGLIDFGDARVGDIFYELIALHLDVFDCDKRLLREFLQAYGYLPSPDFPRRALSMTLLHQFNVLEPVARLYPQIRDLVSLGQLENLFWGVEENGC